ncbi:IclR family transcriptional regulator [Jatrophihabitans fulvus]
MAAERLAPRDTIQAVHRAALVLGLFTVRRPRLPGREIADRLGASRTTAQRYTMALRSVGLLRYDERTALYSLGPRVLDLEASARAGSPVARTAEPVMAELAVRTRCTVVLTVWDGASALVIGVVDDTDEAVRVALDAGARLDAVGSAPGRVHCAFLPAGGPAADAVQDTALAADLARIRQGGLSTGPPDAGGVRMLAAPVFRRGTPLAALALVGTAGVLPDGVGSSAAGALHTAAQTVSRLLDAAPPDGSGGRAGGDGRNAGGAPTVTA